MFESVRAKFFEKLNTLIEDFRSGRSSHAHHQHEAAHRSTIASAAASTSKASAAAAEQKRPQQANSKSSLIRNLKSNGGRAHFQQPQANVGSLSNRSSNTVARRQPAAADDELF